MLLVSFIVLAIGLDSMFPAMGRTLVLPYWLAALLTVAGAIGVVGSLRKKPTS
jgi:hypothetical protein